MTTARQPRRLTALAVGVGLTLTVSLALLVLPPITDGVLLELRDMLPFGAAQDLGPSAQRAGGIALVLLLTIVAAAPLVATGHTRRVLLPAAAAVLVTFCLTTILFNGILYLPGAVALAVAANQQRRRSAAGPA